MSNFGHFSYFGQRLAFTLTAVLFCPTPAAAAASGPICTEFFSEMGAKSYLRSVSEAASSEMRKQGHAPSEAIGKPELWDVDGVPKNIDLYETSFSGVLKKAGVRETEDFFGQELKARKRNGQSSHILDLFGSGLFLNNRKRADSVTGLRFGPIDKNSIKLGEGETVPTEVLGDITSPATWSRLDDSMRDRQIDGMDIVVMRPVGGWMRAPWIKSEQASIAVMKFIIANVAARLKKGGVFLFDLEDQSKKLVKLLREFSKEVEQNTPYRLVIYERREAGWITGISGMLVTKSR